MPTVADVVRRYGPAYLERFGETIPAAHKKVLRAIAACRTSELGTVLYRCEDCERMHAVGRVVRRPPLPELSARQGRGLAGVAVRSPAAVPLLPGHLHPAVGPAGRRARRSARRLRGAVRGLERGLARLAADPRYLGTARLGFFGVLHTWGRTLEYHPHVHYVVPGGGLSADGDRWLASRADFLVPVKALSIVFRGKFRDLLAREGLLEAVDPSVWRGDWVVHCQPAGDGRESLRYLAPYVFRVAIGDHRIVSCDDGRVTFTYREVGSKR